MKPVLELQISRSALTQNLAHLRRVVGDCCLIAPCVKGNAYGHGLEQVCQVLDKAGADGFCVYTMEDARRVQSLGITKPILVLGPVGLEDASEIVERDLRVLAWETGLLGALQDAAKGKEYPARVHVAVDTGMTRYGVLAGADAVKFAKEALQFPHVRIEGVMTHFSSSDEDEKSKTVRQFELLQRFVHDFKGLGGTPSIIHAANSAAAMRFPESRLQMIRPGRLIYGYAREMHDEEMESGGFTQVLRVASWIAQIKKVTKGTPVGYNETYICNKDTTVAVLPAGYADGISRFLANKGEVLISGKRCKILGKICMNATMVDVSDCENVNVGDEVVFLGGQGDEYISTFEVAELQNTVPYNIVTNFQDSLPRVLVD